MHELQKKEKLWAGSRLSRPHIEWTRMKMKVKWAAQTLSSSVADAIDFCRDDLHLKEFEDSQATTQFIRVFDGLFDLLNSRNLLGSRFKAPLKVMNRQTWEPFAAEAFFYIKDLKNKTGVPICETRLKTRFLGFLCNILSLEQIFDVLVTNGPLQFILTYKFSQVNIFVYDQTIQMW